jgi:hypothetical protein
MAHMKQRRAATITSGIEAMKAPTLPANEILRTIVSKKCSCS